MRKNVFAVTLAFALSLSLFSSHAYSITGDIDGDGILSQSDADAVFAFAAGGGTLTNKQRIDADIDRDGYITVADAAQIYRSVETGESLPINKVININVTLPSKTVYNQGEDFDATGISVTLVYADTTVRVVEDYVISGYGSEPGTKIITVTHGRMKRSFPVTVLPKTPEAVEVTSNPLKTEYLVNEVFSSAGLEVTARFTDGTEAPVKCYVLDGYTGNKGTNTVTVWYGGLTTQFDVNVVEAYATPQYNAVVNGGDQYLRCRSGPSTEYPILGTFAEGQSVTRIGDELYGDGWCRVKGIDTKGFEIEGYSYASYIKYTK